MNQKLYDLMDWGRIEDLVYSEDDNPHEILGAFVTKEGVLVQAFLPTAEKVIVRTAEGEYAMERMEENGFYAVLIPADQIPSYVFDVEYDDGSKEILQDPYLYQDLIPERILKKFKAGICYDIYKYLGAHPTTIGGVRGISFAVWAPNAVRVSIVGDFNLWDGRRLPMRKISEYGIFELFVPGMPVGTIYKYEIKAGHALTYLKSDPYGYACEAGPNHASIVSDLKDYEWKDAGWIAERSEIRSSNLPMAVYQLHLGTWKKPEDGRAFYTYRELADQIAEYVSSMGYTHVELLPVMEHPSDDSMGFSVTGYYAPTSRFGTPQDFMYFVDVLHQNNIGVILGWVPSHFSRDLNGLIGFDGTCLYEHFDSRQAYFAQDGGLIFNYARPEVKNFLIANALFWKNVYHVDGLRTDDLARMLYLDYGKGPGQWVPNLFGGNENLDAVEFFKHLDSIYHKEYDGALLIAEDTSQWPMVTTDVEDDGLGMDYKWNNGFKNALIDYMQLDPVFRGPHHQELIFSMIYNYSEHFMLAFGMGDMTDAYGSMYAKMPGKRKNKLANLRAAYGYICLHPGKKLFAMGCDLAQKKAMNPGCGVDWTETENEENQQFRTYMKTLLTFYRDNPALYALDYVPDGFEWINNISAQENMLVFLRKSGIEEQMLLCVVNFSNVVYKNHKIGVPFSGKYKEIFNSDDKKFGGEGNGNPRVKASKMEECDELPNSIRITVPPLGISVFSCVRSEAEALLFGTDAAITKKKSPAKKTAAKKNTAKKSTEHKRAEKSSTASKRSASKEQALKKKTLKEELEEKVNREDHR